ncbi:F-box domain-containing protein/FBA_1 domain-containing protein [Cephalotus follicularis]|uniref:F-box domain-containing protein/FBA_1 domain-containing protein n=1 Tax=Cephalotus follicularis TaxID=3775 RepID=A0A1Q3BZU3_CEPFO|nr:F-box domain-containing protein/FBA_1 domain-containing protein [Cephalotus follicularis]
MLPAAGSVNMKRINGYGESTISCLPEDILIDIFARLSIKAIVTCRCVSKTLRDLLSSSNSRFTKYHFARSDVQLIVETGLCKYYFYFLELEDDTGFDDKIKLSRSRFGLSRCNLVALNSCNGFLCLGLSSEYKWNPVKICNPITGEYLNLPTNKMDDFIEDPVVSGFGCTANTHQYKVVRLVRRRDPVTGEKFGDRMVEVYTIGTKLWRTIGIAPINPHGPRRLLCTTFFNGAIHWVCNDKHCSEFILSFDLESEKFGFVPPPPQFSLKPIMERYAIRIGVLGEFFYFSHNMELWVMK